MYGPVPLNAALSRGVTHNLRNLKYSRPLTRH
jgi:hypothetical protein